MKCRVLVTFGILCAIFAQCAGQSLLERITSIALMGAEESYNIAKNVAKFIVTPEEMVEVTKELLYDLPSSTLMQLANVFCSQAVAADENLNRSEEVIPDYSKVRLTFYHNEWENTSFPLADIETLIEHPSFDWDAPVVIFMMGWLSNRRDRINNGAELLYDAYKCRGHTNFLFLDPDHYIDTLYTWSAVNTDDLGRLLARAVADLAKHVDTSKFHVIGHSLGSHIAGATGRYFKELTQTSLPRITGLDPAMVCFNQGEVLTGLGSGDAAFVDVIHTNSGGMGQRKVIGDVDFYPNGVTITMPGCFSLACSHARSWIYYAESVRPGRERAFLATRCGSYTAYKLKFCNREVIPMGFATPVTAKGTFFLETNAEEPYGKNSVEPNKCVDEVDDQ